MFLRRSAILFTRRAPLRLVARRTFVSSAVRSEAKPEQPSGGQMKKFEEVKTESDLLPPGGRVGTIPSDMDQATGLERLEILGKMQGVDIFDMRPLDSSRKGTLNNPIVVKSFGDEQYAGCTGSPADSHNVIWLTMSRERPLERCPECGSVYEMEYVGPQDDHSHDHGDHGHDHHAYEEPKTFADFVKPEYR